MIRWAGWLRERGHQVDMIDIEPYMSPLRRIRFVRKRVKELAPDIVHGFYLTGGGFYASISGAKHVVVSAWGSDVYLDSHDFLKGLCVKYALKHSDAVMGVSDHILDVCKSRIYSGSNHYKVVVGVDTQKFSPAPYLKNEKFTFLSIRPTTPIYNPIMIVDAFEEADLDAQLLMKEPGLDPLRVKTYVTNHHLDDKVEFYHSRPYDEMPAFYNQAHVGISVPNWDGCSPALLECMACAVPVITSDLDHNLGWVDPELAPSPGLSGTDPLSDLMTQAYMTPRATLQTIGWSGREKVKAKAEFDTEMQKAEAIYQEVVGREWTDGDGG